MRHFFDVFKHQINMSKTTAGTMAVVLISVGMMLHTGQTPTVPVGDAIATKAVGDTFASSDAIATKLVGDAFATISTNPLSEAFATKPTGDAIAAKPGSDTIAKPDSDAIAPNPIGDAIVTRPASDAIAPKPVGDAIANKPDSDASATKPPDGSIAIKPTGDAIATKPSDTVATKPIGEAIATKPAIATKKAAPAPQTKLADEWQDWPYCLAPSRAEHKIYFTAPIRMIGILGRADAAFHEMLNKAGIPHDEVQCPKAPNKRTLLFRQRYAIRLNGEIGNATITLNWNPGVD
jgi:hypothetical protein